MEAQQGQRGTASIAGAIVGVSIVFGLLFDYLLFGKIPGVAFPLYVILVVAGLFILARIFKKQIRKDVVWLLIPLVFFSTMVFVRSSESLTFLNGVASVLLLLIIAEVSFGEQLKTFMLWQYARIVFLPVQFLRPLFKTLADACSLRGVTKNHRTLLPVVKGVVMAVPAIFIFLLLFSSADLIFQKYISDFITIELEEETMVRIVLVFIVTLVSIGAYSYSFRDTKNHDTTQEQNSTGRIGHIESSILLGSINVLFFIFILVQLAYLFGGENTILSQGFTYAEYARRGFFELITASMLTLLILLAIEKYITKKDTNHARWFTMASTGLIVQVLVIMASAFMRLSLYEAAYGFTNLRLYSHAFIILLAIIFCSLLYKIYKDKRENAFAFRTFVAIIFFLATLNVLNPDAFIARKNIERFATAGTLDVNYVFQLSDDAIPVTIHMLSESDEEVRNSVARELYRRIERHQDSFFTQWQSLNLSRMRADSILNANIAEIEPYKDYPQQSGDGEVRE